MQEPKIDFSKFKSTAENGYRRKAERNGVMSAFNAYVVCPITFLALILGTMFCADDAIKRIKTTPLPDTLTEETVRCEETQPVEETTAVPIAPPENDEPYIWDEDGNISKLLSDYYRDKIVTGDIYEFDRSKVPQGHLGIIPLSLNRPVEDGVMYVSNSSKYKFDYKDYLEKELPEIFDEEKNGDDYYVLVVHTHGTEAYTPDGVISDSIEDPYYTRSKDNEKNVVSVGAVFAEELNESGIKTLHYDIAIDEESYTDAYKNSAAVIKQLLNKHPTIKYVFDIHRDGVTLSSGEKAKVVCEINGKTAAQVMFVVGTDTLGQKHDGWRDNLALAVQLQMKLEDRFNEFTRPISIKQGAYNQQYSPMGLLIEFGSDGNTLAEAKYSAKMLARELAHLIKGE